MYIYIYYRPILCSTIERCPLLRKLKKVPFLSNIKRCPKFLKDAPHMYVCIYLYIVWTSYPFF